MVKEERHGGQRERHLTSGTALSDDKCRISPDATVLWKIVKGGIQNAVRDLN